MGPARWVRPFAVVIDDVTPFVRIKVDDRGRFSARLPERAKKDRNEPLLQGGNEQQDAGYVGQKPGHQQQNSGKYRENSRHSGPERIFRNAETKAIPRAPPGGTDN